MTHESMPLAPSSLQEQAWHAYSALAYAYTGAMLTTTAAFLEALLGRGETAVGQVHLTQGPGYLGLSVWF